MRAARGAPRRDGPASLRISSIFATWNSFWVNARTWQFATGGDPSNGASATILLHSRDLMMQQSVPIKEERLVPRTCETKDKVAVDDDPISGFMGMLTLFGGSMNRRANDYDAGVRIHRGSAVLRKRRVGRRTSPSTPSRNRISAVGALALRTSEGA